MEPFSTICSWDPVSVYIRFLFYFYSTVTRTHQTFISGHRKTRYLWWLSLTGGYSFMSLGLTLRDVDRRRTKMPASEHPRFIALVTNWQGGSHVLSYLKPLNRWYKSCFSNSFQCNYCLIPFFVYPFTPTLMLSINNFLISDYLIFYLFLVLVSAVFVIFRLSFVCLSFRAKSSSPGYCFHGRFSLRVMLLIRWNLNHLPLSLV